MRYRLNGPEVVAETLDGEALIVHLGTGAYYTCGGAGEVAWAQLLAGATVEQVADALATAFAIPRDQAEQDAASFVAEALAQGLVVEATREYEGSVPGATGRAYASPAFDKYTDMEQLLALDPIHDVDTAEGWPAVKAEH